MLITRNNDIIEDDELERYLWDDENSAFIKFDNTNGEDRWIVFLADGTKVAEVDSKEQAFIIAKQNDFEPFSVH